ncbi:MAG: hypothetical protein ACI4JZ_02665, partial [Oscillospiraceae bacterium]
MKKVLTFIISILSAVVLSATAFAESAGFAVESELVSPAKTPYDKKYVKILWNTAEASSAGVPLCAGEFLFAPVGNKLNKLSEKDGKLVSSVEFEEKVSENYKGAILGKTLVQPTRTGICVVDTEQMSVLQFKKFGEIVTDVAVLDNLAFFGVKTAESCAFYCVDMNKNLDIVAEYKTENQPSSPALFNNFVVFSSGEKLVCFSTTDKIFIENQIGAKVNYVFAGQYAIFMSGDDGFMYKLRLLDNGKVEEDSLLKCEVGGTLTAPAEADNRLYVGSTEGFFVLDGLNMEISKKFPQMKNACAPVITLGSGLRIYTVAPVESDGGKWYLYGILDSDTEQSVNEIVKIIDFTNGKITVSNNGIMFFRDNP